MLKDDLQVKTKVWTHERQLEYFDKEVELSVEDSKNELLLCAEGHEDLIVNKITGDCQDDEDFTMIPTDGKLTIATADNC